jgi:hypothetical protein
MGQIRNIRPEEVQDVLPAQVGGMIYSKEAQKWVREAESGEDASEDPFGDIESIASTPRSGRRHIAKDVAVAEVESVAESGPLPPPPIFANLSAIHYDSDFTHTSAELSEHQDAPQAPTDISHSTPHVQHQSLEELSAGIANISLQMDLSPPRPARPTTVTQGLAPKSLPRSVLKPTPPMQSLPSPSTRQRTPRNTHHHRRSVSFSDGRKSGKIRDDDTSSIAETEETEKSRDAAAGDFPTTRSYVPSTRTKRIHDMLDELNNNDSGKIANLITRAFS